MLAVFAMVAAACSSSDDDSSGELTPVKLQLQWFTQAQFAGYFAAVD
ncbi:MAG: ABC transporter substrate-binding protein, partial [Actinomycetia bacterium]|nr:ABC transporter substrate-binding protein [Actinomycetes bacterium]